MTPGDTTYTKVFVGGLAWETQQDTMKNYFEQFGQILEAVVITHKTTGRSKGYGFVTFAEPEAAMSACADATPLIDGRRANCNLAAFGPQRSKISTPNHGGGRMIGGAGGLRTALASAATFPHYAIQQGIPFTNIFGYPPCSAEDAYLMNYYGVYGGAAAQYPIIGAGAGAGGMFLANAANYYPYLNINREGSGGAIGYMAGHGYGVQYPHQLFQYSTGVYPQHYRTPISFDPAAPLQSGMTMALHAPIPIPYH